MATPEQILIDELAFYADERNYCGYTAKNRLATIEHDLGAKARKALQAYNEAKAREAAEYPEYAEIKQRIGGLIARYGAEIKIETRDVLALLHIIDGCNEAKAREAIVKENLTVHPDQATFTLTAEEYDKLTELLDAPARELPELKRLFQRKTVLDDASGVDSDTLGSGAEGHRLNQMKNAEVPKNSMPTESRCNSGLASLRKSLKLNQTEFANLIGATQAAISQYESGERLPALDVFHRMRSALKISSDTLLDAIYGEVTEAKHFTQTQLTEYGKIEFSKGYAVAYKEVESRKAQDLLTAAPLAEALKSASLDLVTAGIDGQDYPEIPRIASGLDQALTKAETLIKYSEAVWAVVEKSKQLKEVRKKYVANVTGLSGMAEFVRAESEFIIAVEAFAMMEGGNNA